MPHLVWQVGEKMRVLVRFAVAAGNYARRFGIAPEAPTTALLANAVEMVRIKCDLARRWPRGAEGQIVLRDLGEFPSQPFATLNGAREFPAHGGHGMQPFCVYRGHCRTCILPLCALNNTGRRFLKSALMEAPLIPQLRFACIDGAVPWPVRLPLNVCG